MKYSYNWLKELSDTKKSVEEIADLFMTHSFEVEGVEDLSKGLENVVIGEVMTKEKHPDADRLSVATVNVGENELQIVCGAPNLEVGQKVPVALVGCVLKGEFKIKQSKIRGVESNGMICAEDELGVGNDHEGIMVLPNDAPVGEKFVKYAKLDDSIIDLDILPNRGHDCLSHIGIANEICALENIDVKCSYEKNLTEIESPIEYSIEYSKCNRYVGVKIDNIEIKNSPDWMKARLQSSDITPKNNIVDITNYIMLETGQPLHAFDASSIQKIKVRQAVKKEKIKLLDEQELTLDEKDIVITDGENPIALAGVMGGQETAISESTTNIILEAASFDASSVRLTQRKYNLQTDAAYRFERNIDPNLAGIAAAKAIELFIELANGTVTGVTDIYPEPVKSWHVNLDTKKVVKMLGVEIEIEKMKNILKRLGIECDIKEDILVCTIPTIRIDLQTQEDLIEEIGRMYGYDKIKPEPLKESVQTPVRNEQRFFERALKDIFVYGGFDEVKSYSFYGFDDARAIGLNDENHITLMNPMNPEQAIMRRSLMPNLLNFTKKNFSYFDRVQIFEIGRIYDPVDAVLPDEKLVIGAVVASKDNDGTQFFEMKGMLETLFDRINIGDYYFDSEFDENEEHLPNLHPSRRAMIKMQSGKVIGWMGETDKKESKYFGLKKNRAVVCELNVELMLTEVKSENFFEPLAKYPFVSRDLSMIVGDRTCVGDVEKVIYNAGGELVKDVDLFDLYQNEEIGERSMAFHIVFGNSDRTLKAEEVDEKIEHIITIIEKELAIEVRK